MPVSMFYYLSLAVSIIANTASLILLKQGMVSMAGFSDRLADVRTWIALLGNGYVVMGMILFAVSFFTWMIALSRIDLSLAYPTVSLTYGIVAVASHYLFSEVLPWNRFVGILVIMTGIFIMYRW